MKVFTSLEGISDIGRTSVALGNFDGIHKGHLEIINSCVKKAQSSGISSAVFTFTNHPMNVIAPGRQTKNIIDFETKAEIIASLGVDYLISIPFTTEFMSLSENEFVESVLIAGLNAAELFCGFNYSFGRRGSGTPEKLKMLCEAFGVSVNVIPEIQANGKTVSSTLLRKYLEEGNVGEFFICAGRHYSVKGRIAEGRHIGRTIGFPTINMKLDADMALPKNGVYVTCTRLNNCLYPSVTNVGFKPTVGACEKNAETHIFGFDSDVYGEHAEIEFLRFLRSEKLFDSLDDLKKQIAQDCKAALAYHTEDANEVF